MLKYLFRRRRRYYYYYNTASRSQSFLRKMADCPQFQNVMPQVVPIYRPSPPPPPPTTVTFPLPAPPVFGPISFGYPPVTWSPIHHHYPPLPTSQQQPAFNRTDDGIHGPVNGVPIQQQLPQMPFQQQAQLLPLPVYFNGAVGPANETQPAFQQRLPLKQQHSGSKVAYNGLTDMARGRSLICFIYFSFFD